MFNFLDLSSTRYFCSLSVVRKKACLHRRETDDNWEPYQQVALLREKLIEPDSVEDQESDGSGSEVSHPTYGI